MELLAASSLAAALLVPVARPPATATLGVPGRSNSSAAIAADGEVVAIAWAAAAPGGATDIYCAISRDGGRRFGAAVRVNDSEGDARVTGEQPPRIAIRARSGGQSDVFVSWISKRDATTIRLARSVDGGRTFGASRAVSTPGAAGSRGWHAMTLDPRGNADLVWLDHRNMAGAAHEARQADPSSHGMRDGAAMAQLSSLYIARVTGNTVEPERRVTAGVCYCCKTAIAAAPDGAIVAAWRHVYPGNIRDIAFARAPDGRTFAAPVRVSADHWELDGCPEDGPSLAVDASARTHIVWPTLVKEGKDAELAKALFYASSRDGWTFTARQPIPTEGTPRHPQLAIAPDGSPVVTWDEIANGVRRVAFAGARLDARGAVRFVREVVTGREPAVYPVVAATRQGLLIAWTSGGLADSVIRFTRAR